MLIYLYEKCDRYLLIDQICDRENDFDLCDRSYRIVLMVCLDLIKC